MNLDVTVDERAPAPAAFVDWRQIKIHQAICSFSFKAVYHGLVMLS